MPAERVSLTRYRCDGPGCRIVTENAYTVRAQWIRARLPGKTKTMRYHRVECAIAHLSDLSNGFDAAIIRAHLLEPRPAGAL
jgi:hypothetical protein